MISVYNGVRYRIKIFNKKINSLVGKFNLESGEENIPYEFKNSNGDVTGTIYGEKCDELNNTRIEVPCMKHYRSEFDTAVQTQLLFFDNVNYYHESINGDRHEIHFKSKVLYNSNNIIIADKVPYSKPYVVIVNGNQSVGVCYGVIDFKELELQQIHGAIGIKCNIRQLYDDPDTGEEIVINEGIDVVASREAVRWTPATRSYLLSKFETAQDEATNIIEQELKTDDFLEWLKTCSQLGNNSNNNSALSKLSNIVDFNTLRPEFKSSGIKFHPLVDKMFEGFSVKLHTSYRDPKDGNKFKTKRDTFDHTSTINFDSIYLAEKLSTGRIKDVYIASINGNEFVTITPDDLEAELEHLQKTVAANIDKKQIEVIAKRQETILNLLKSSKYCKTYDDIDVPEDYHKTLLKLETEAEEAVIAKELTTAEKRALEDRIVMNRFVSRDLSYYNQHEELFKKDKVEPKIGNIKDYAGQLYYGFQVDDSKLQYAMCLLGKQYNRESRNDLEVVSISKNYTKLFQKFNHIDEFFGKPEVYRDENNKIKGTQIIMNTYVIKWNTARLLKKRMGNLDFMKNFSIFDQKMSELYKEIVAYINAYNFDTDAYLTKAGMREHNDEFVKFLDNLGSLQEFIDESANDDLKDKISEIGNLPDDLKKVLVYDTDMINKLEDLLKFANPIKHLLNHVEVLVQIKDISLETQLAIAEFVEFKSK